MYQWLLHKEVAKFEVLDQETLRIEGNFGLGLRYIIRIAKQEKQGIPLLIKKKKSRKVIPEWFKGIHNKILRFAGLVVFSETPSEFPFLRHYNWCA